MRKENLMNLHTFDGEVKKIERKYMGHFIDASFCGKTVNYVRLGEDLEEYNIEMNPDTEVRKNILGNSSFVHNGYEPTSDADPFYARSGDPLFEKLQEIVDTLATGDTCKTTAVEVHLWETSGEGAYKAYKQGNIGSLRKKIKIQKWTLKKYSSVSCLAKIFK